MVQLRLTTSSSQGLVRLLPARRAPDAPGHRGDLKAIADADGNEVFLVGSRGEDGRVSAVTIGARGNEEAVPVLEPHLAAGNVILHNHPSGDIRPSNASLSIAARLENPGHRLLHRGQRAGADLRGGGPRGNEEIVFIRWTWTSLHLISVPRAPSAASIRFSKSVPHRWTCSARLRRRSITMRFARLRRARGSGNP